MLLEEVDFLLLLSAPKVALGKTTIVGVLFQSLADNEILPQCAGIVAVFDWGEVTDNRVANAKVPKINFAARF